MVWKVTDPPDAEPVTIAEVKDHLNVDLDDHDAKIVGLIEMARQHVERTCNRAIMPQTWKVSLDSFGNGEVPLPGGNVTAVSGVTYFDTNNVEQTLDASDYIVLLTEPAKIAPVGCWPLTYRRPDAVNITIDVGYADAASVPSPIKFAMYLHAELLYDRPSGPYEQSLERARDNLLFPYIDGQLLT